MVCPCAVGGVLTTALADRIKAWAVCGAANNVLAEPAAERRLGERGILFVPDVLASSGAVIKGVTSVIMRLPDSAPLIDAIGETARSILTESRESRRPASEIAHERARARIAAARAAATPPAGRPGAAPREPAAAGRAAAAAVVVVGIARPCVHAPATQTWPSPQASSLEQAAVSPR